MSSPSWPGPSANCEAWQRRGDVHSLCDKQLGHALVLGVENLMVDELRLPPGARRVDHLNEWDGTFSVGTERDAPSFVGACEVALAPGVTGEDTSAFCQEPGGFGSTNDLRAPNALLRGELERGGFAVRGGAGNCASVLIEQRERHADARDQRSRP